MELLHRVESLHPRTARDQFTRGALRLIETEQLVVSPVVELELTVLSELERFADDGSTIVDSLMVELGVIRSDASMSSVVRASQSLSWTHDPFDRLITADAIAANCQLLTSDATIRANCDLAVW